MADPRINVILGARDDASKVVTGLRGQFAKFKQDAVTGFGLGAGINFFNMGKKALGSLVDMAGDAVGMASNLAESQSKVDEVFEDSADQIHDWSTGLIQDFGLTERAALEAAGTFGNFLQAMGTTREEAVDMSQGLVELAADLAAFNNTDVDDVLVSLRAGIAGEAEPMRRLGADVSAARVETILLANGVQKVNGKFTEGQKVLGRYEAILKDTATAQGNFALTSEGMAGQQKIAAAEMETALTDLGEALLPLMTDFTRFAADVIPQIAGAIGNLGDAFNNLNRFINPHIGEMQDLLEMLPEIAKEYGVSEEQVLSFLDAEKRAIKATEGLTAADKIFAEGIVRDIELFKEMEQPAEKRIELLAEATGLTYEQAKAISDENATTEERVEQAILYKRALVEQAAAVEVMTEAERKGRAAAEQAAEALRQQDIMVEALTGSFMGLSPAAEEVGHVFDGLAPAVRDARQSAIREAIQIGPSLRDAIKSNRATVRKAMTDLRWAMEHPFAGDRYIKFLEGKQRQANRLWLKALREGKIDAAVEAAAVRTAVERELGQLKTVWDIEVRATASFAAIGTSVTDRMAPRPGGWDGDPKTPYPRAFGGPVSSGQTYLVGERGPELLHMGGNGYVTPNNKMGGHGHSIYLDGRLVGRAVDQRLGDRASLTRSGNDYRSAD